MPDANALSNLAERLHLDFTGPIRHEKVVTLAHAWLPDINFHEVEMYYPIDLEELYTRPAELFATFDPLVQQEFAVTVGGVKAAPPIVRVGDVLRGSGDTADEALLEADVDANAVYSYGGNLRAGDKFFGSETTKDGTEVPGVGNPRLPRLPLRVRTEFRMLLETLKHELALRAEVPPPPGDAIWGDFDVTDLLLRKFENNTDHPASPEVRHAFARDLIREFEAGNFIGVEQLLQNPPPDGPLTPTTVNHTVWLALSTCGLMEYYFTYAYNDFIRYGGVFTNEHEVDDEGCCVVFERLALQDLQTQNGDPRTVVPLGIITSVHKEANRADEVRAIDADPGDARDGLDVFVARGSHATYLTPGTHDFFDVSDAARQAPEVFALTLLLCPPLILLFIIYEHFNGDPDVASDNGVSGQHEVDPASDPKTHLPVELVVTPLSNIDNDENIYKMTEPPPQASAALLVRRAFRGRLGAHDGFIDQSSPWDNKTRRYFKKLVEALESGTFRPPRKPVVIL
jgi:hypothetical protein